jgi:2-haloacid dehalogenase
MQYAIGFDVYGTLVDSLKMADYLRHLVGDKAERFALLWREKQLEYTWRRGLMQNYENFDVCTKHALLFVMQALKVELSLLSQEQLLNHYQNLQAFPDVISGLPILKAQGHTLVAFSNGVEATLQSLLKQAGILPYLDGIISVDHLKTFKPDPKVYIYLANRLNRSVEETWLVSSNCWDVIGAKSAGLKSVWLQRQSNAIFDPWDISPDLVVASIEDLSNCWGK